jgi:RNA polymerase sigma factor (TIGR02999 family)
VADPREITFTDLLRAAAGGDTPARDQVLERVYDDLRRLAKSRLAEAQGPATIQPTALVHEAWLKVLGGAAASFEDRREFFIAAAIAMRSILVDRARRRTAEKRGGDRRRVELADLDVAATAQPQEILALHDALARLDEKHRQIVELRFFAGLGMNQVADTLGLPLRSLEREWTFIRAVLHRELSR